MSLDTDAIDFVARERGISPAFVEKDWYATQVIRAIADYSASGITPIFSGGTSLSKAFGIIQRFSEDLDFRGRFDTAASPNKTARRAFRHDMLNVIASPIDLTLIEESIVSGSNYFKCSLTYPQAFSHVSALRPTLLVEFSYTQPVNTPEVRSVTSMVSEYKGMPAETHILCLSPIETAADKLSALTWRVLKRDRKAPHDDPAMRRHLHDLYALKDSITQNQIEFANTAQTAYDADNKTTRRALEHPLSVSVNKAAASMKADGVYQDEYRTFVDGMSYAADDERIQFDSALDYFGGLASLFEGNQNTVASQQNLSEAFTNLPFTDNSDVDFSSVMNDSPRAADLED